MEGGGCVVVYREYPRLLGSWRLYQPSCTNVIRGSQFSPKDGCLNQTRHGCQQNGAISNPTEASKAGAGQQRREMGFSKQPTIAARTANQTYTRHGVVIATLGSILDSQPSLESGKFQLARWSHIVVIFPKGPSSRHPHHKDLSC